MVNEAEKFKKARTERPDKAAFSAFIGTFLLIVGTCFGVWAFWTFNHYRSAADYAEYLRQNPNALSDSKYNQNEIIRSNQLSADHDKLEAIWTGAVSLLGLSLAALLFVRAFRIYRRLKHVEYEEIDWRTLDKPAHKVEVLYGRIFSIATIIFYIFFGGLTLLVLFTGFKSGGIRTNGLILVSFNLLLLSAFAYLTTKGKRKSIKSFDASGITRNDGRHFLWGDFRGAIPRIGSNRFGNKYNWRTELMFADGGEIWVIP